MSPSILPIRCASHQKAKFLGTRIRVSATIAYPLEPLRTHREVRMEEWLRVSASVASILTSIIATGASFVYWWNKRSKRTRLETYLKAKKEKSPNEAFSVTWLMANLGMTEAEVFAASFASRQIARGVRARSIWPQKAKPAGVNRRARALTAIRTRQGRHLRLRCPRRSRPLRHCAAT